MLSDENHPKLIPQNREDVGEIFQENRIAIGSEDAQRQAKH